jgi:predicted nuclease with TOPRIM domain
MIMLKKIQLVSSHLVRWTAVAALTLATQISHAALFEDEEARRAIIDLRQRMQVTQDQLSKIATSESILELANQNEQLRSELAQLRGQNEQLARAVDELRALVSSADSRLSQLEPATVSVDNENFSVGPKEKADYETAMTALRGGNFEAAGGILTTLLRDASRTCDQIKPDIMSTLSLCSSFSVFCLPTSGLT